MVKYSVSELKLLLYRWHELKLYIILQSLKQFKAHLDHQKQLSMGTFGCFLIQIT